MSCFSARRQVPGQPLRLLQGVRPADADVAQHAVVHFRELAPGLDGAPHGAKAEARRSRRRHEVPEAAEGQVATDRHGWVSFLPTEDALLRTGRMRGGAK